MKLDRIHILSAAFVVLCCAGCNQQEDWSNAGFFDAEETMTLSVSAEEVELVEENINDIALTFEWTPAREMPDEYMVSYITKLDVEGSDFGNCVRTMEDDGVFFKSYTVGQLQNLLTEKWGKNWTRMTTLQFRVIAKWEGGSTYVMPEVRTISVDVRPWRPIVFDADKVYLTGESVQGESRHQMTKTIENEFIYAAWLELKKGETQIQVEYDGATNYICPADSEGTLVDGGMEDVVMKADAVSWNIPYDGKYRFVLDMQNKNVVIYSPATDLKPFTVTWSPNNSEALGTLTTEVTNLWGRGDPAGWAASGKDLQCTQSLADPQVLIYSGASMSGRIDFPITTSFELGGASYTVNNAYVFAPADTYTTPTDTAAPHGTWMNMQGGSGLERGYYFRLPSGTNFIIFDLRNMRMKTEKR